MTTSIKKIMLQEQIAASEGTCLESDYLTIVGQLHVECVVRLGTLSLKVSELRTLHDGQVLPLIQKVNEPVDLLLNDRIIARGDLMCVEDYFAIKITERIAL